MNLRLQILLLLALWPAGKTTAQVFTPLAGTTAGNGFYPGVYHAPTNAIYIAGGWGGSYLNEVRKYDITANSWSVLTTANGVPADLGSVMGYAFALNNKVYFSGGVDGGYVWSAKTWELDPVSNTFTRKDDIPSANSWGRAYGFSFAIGNKGYAGMGVGSSTGSASWVANNTFLQFDPALPAGAQWTAMTPYPGAGIEHITAAVLNGVAYVGLGNGDPVINNEQSDFWRYDPAAGAGGTWTAMAGFPGGPRQDALLLPACGKIILIGGTRLSNSPSSPNVSYDDIWEFDPGAGPIGAWRQIGNYPATINGRFEPAYAVTGTDIYYGLGVNWTSGMLGDWMRINFNAKANAGAADTALCAGDSIVLLADTISGAHYSWTGPNGFASGRQRPVIPNVVAAASGAYILSVSLPGCGSDSDTVHITVADVPVVDLGPDTALCADSLVLQSSGSYTSPAYLWSGGQTTPALKAGQSGSYWLQVTENGCKGSDTINITLNPSLTVDLGNDTGICDRDIPLMLVSPQPPGTQYLWSTGLTTPSINVTRTDTYWLKVTLGDCKGTDTITVNVILTPPIHIGNDSFICEGQPVNIGDVVPGADYLWNTGSTSSSIEVSESGSYWLTADLEGCKVSDTVQITVTPLPAPDLGPDGDICPEQVIVLDAAYAGGSWQWSTGDTTSSVSVSSAGVYWIKVRSAYGCTGGDTVTFNYYPLPVVSLGADTTVCEETPLLLQPFHTNSDSLCWSDGSAGETLTVSAGGQYIVAGINKCGETRDTVLIKQIFCDIWVPNAFTPNGDGVNDLFRVLGNTGRLESFRLRVFNRWGQLLFETSDRTKGWDGRQQGGEALLGVYVYMLEYSLHEQPVMQKGNFTLLR